MTCGVEGDVFAYVGILCPFCECLLYGGGRWQGKDGLVGMTFRCGKPSQSVGIEFVGDGVLCLLHDDGVVVVVTHLVDIAPSDVANVAETQPCETAEKEAAFYLLIAAGSLGEPDDFVSEEKRLDDYRSLRHFVALHVRDGVGEDGLVNSGLSKHAFEGAEIVVGCDT